MGSNPWPHCHPSLTRPDNRRFIHRINLPIEPQLVGLPEHLSGDGRLEIESKDSNFKGG